MVKEKLLVLTLFCAVSSLGAFAELPPLQTVPFVDATKFVGRWYQIERNPLPFEPANCVCTQQTLTLQNDGRVGVFNSCNVGEPGGQLVEIRGVATSNNPQTNAQFTVDFGLGFTGQYWIIAVERNYQWAVVSDPDRRSLYILSKRPWLSSYQLRRAKRQAARQIDVSRLVKTSHVACTYPARAVR